MSHSIIWFSVLLAVASILTKIFGCGIAQRYVALQTEACRSVAAWGSRGEVALNAQQGRFVDLMSARISPGQH
jgi:hypothetical protein